MTHFLCTLLHQPYNFNFLSFKINYCFFCFTTKFSTINQRFLVFFSLIHFILSSSAFFLQYGKTNEMAITLAQSLGQNIGIFSDKKRILNGKPLNLNDPFCLLSRSS